MNQTVFMGLLLLAALVLVGGSLILLGPDEESPEPPVIAFDEEHEMDEVVVTSVSQGLSWDEIQVQISVPGGFKIGEGNLTRVHGMVFTPVDDAKEVEGGDSLRVCIKEPGEEQDSVEITLRHGPSGRILGSWALLSVDACSALEEGEAVEDDTQEDPPEPGGGDGNVTEADTEEDVDGATG